MDWATFFSSITASTAFVAALGLLTKSWLSERLKASIKHEYDHELEKFKLATTAQNALELERLRSQLTISATEHQVRFANQYEQMADAIAEVYKHTSQMYTAVANYIKPGYDDRDGTHAERREKVNGILEQYGATFTAKRIYLPSSTALRIESFHKSLCDVAQEFAIEVEAPMQTSGRSNVGAWSKTWKALTEEIKPLREELENEFRRLIGVPQ